MNGTRCGWLALLLMGCPWISSHPPDELMDTEPGTTVCDDVDFDGICDAQDPCVDGVDDRVDRYAVQSGDVVDGLACWDEDVITLPVDAGCTVDLDVTSPTSVTVDVIHASSVVDTGSSPVNASLVMADYQPVAFHVSGDDAAYTLQANTTCPACRGGTMWANWGDVVTSRLCPAHPELTVSLSVHDTSCQYGVTVITSDQTVTSLGLDDGFSSFVLDDASGYLSVIGPVASQSQRVDITVSQPANSSLEQGVWLDLQQYCD